MTMATQGMRYLLSVYQPDGPTPPPDVLQKIMRDVDVVNRELFPPGNKWCQFIFQSPAAGRGAGASGSRPIAPPFSPSRTPSRTAVRSSPIGGRGPTRAPATRRQAKQRDDHGRSGEAVP